MKIEECSQRLNNGEDANDLVIEQCQDIITHLKEDREVDVKIDMYRNKNENNWAFCMLYRQHEYNNYDKKIKCCEKCPVYRHTRKIFCKGTPMISMIYPWYKYNYSEQMLIASNKQLKFLKGLKNKTLPTPKYKIKISRERIMTHHECRDRLAKGEDPLELSIEKYELLEIRIYEHDVVGLQGPLYNDYDHNSEGLCRKYLKCFNKSKSDCIGCPVYKRTGYKHCIGTPSIQFDVAVINKSREAALDFVAEQIQFLKSLRTQL